jgi:polyphosphate kinase
VGADDRRWLTIALPGSQITISETPETEATAALAAPSEAGRRLRGAVNPAALELLVELEVERITRESRSPWPWRGHFRFVYDAVSVRRSGIIRTFQEIKLRRLRAGGPPLEAISTAMPDVRLILESKLARAQRLSAGLEREALARSLASGRTTAVLALDGGRVALTRMDGHLRLPVGAGQGEAACRHLLQETLGSAVGDLAFLGTVAGVGTVHLLDVWLARRVRRDQESSSDVEWLPLDDVIATAGGPGLGDAETLTAIAFALRSGVSPEPDTAPTSHRARSSTTGHETYTPGDTPLLDPDLSLVEFNSRVLALAEDTRTPILERLGFLAIVSANLDEFFMVNVGALKSEAQDGRLEAVGLRLRGLLERQARTAEACLMKLRSYGVVVRRWDELSESARSRLTERFQRELFPLITPRAITMSPGFPVPLLPHLTLCLAVSLTDADAGAMHFAYLRIPERLPRFLPTGEGGDVVAVEDVVRAHIAAFYPDRLIDGVHLFRLTRAADIDLDDREAGDLLQAVGEAVGTRASNAVVRLEVEQAMPRQIRDRIRWELRFERGAEGSGLSDGDVYEVSGLLDLRALRGLASGVSAGDAGRFPPLAARDPFAGVTDIWARIDAGDILLHHPYDDYSASVVRFFSEAAADPRVASIRLTLYRVGEQSPIVDALLRARETGKEVILFVELKARFDETRNIAWVQRLEDAGATVVYGVVGFKNHAKVGLVLRRDGTELRRYVHVATGNYNASTARQYTDLGLLSADPDLGADVHELFNELTGSSHPPTGSYRRIVVAPTHLLPNVLAAIENEIEHARAGREARIRAKINGLADTDVIRALYRASEAGVEIDLVVRGLCTLRPGLPGVSSRIRVVSILGRFLEHARIFHFANGGEDRYYIGSADWRPRNLRRRVEVLASVLTPAHRARLGKILDIELADPTAWDLKPDGLYQHRQGTAREVGSQERFASESTSDPQGK